MWEHHLHNMYQQWQQGNEDYIYRYMDFAVLAAQHNNTSSDAILLELQKYNWFMLPNHKY